MYPQHIQELIRQLSRLPDIGPRAAARLAFHLLNTDQEEINALSDALNNLKKNTRLCSQCFNICEKETPLCSICSDKKRDHKTICVVENVLNILPIERIGKYDGLYHVINALTTPQNDFLADNLRIKSLIGRVRKNQISEVILALNPTVEGDTTSMYIEKMIKPLKTKTSRLARGLSSGTDMQYADPNTLINALIGRH